MAFQNWGPNAALNKGSLDNFLARMQTLKGFLADFTEFNAGWLAANGSAVLQAAPFSYSSADAATLISAMGDLSSLSTVYYGNATIASGGAITVSAGNGHNFDAFVKLGSGFATHG